MDEIIRNELLKKLVAVTPDEPWGHSQVEKWKNDSLLVWQGNISDFRRMKISSGTINPPDRPNLITDSSYENDSVLKSLLNTFRLLKFLVKMEIHSLLRTKSCFKYLPEMETHKFRRFSYPNNFLSDIGIRMSYYSHRIKSITDKGVEILEIGAGYGALSAYLRGYYSRYIIVDLPENLILAAEFLSNLRIPFGTIENYPSDDFSVYLMSGGDLNRIKSVDVVINTMSMQHMNGSNLEYYFHEIARLNPKILFLLNRNIKRDPTDTEIQNYPIPTNFKVKKSNRIFSKHYDEMILTST